VLAINEENELIVGTHMHNEMPRRLSEIEYLAKVENNFFALRDVRRCDPLRCPGFGSGGLRLSRVGN